MQRVFEQVAYVIPSFFSFHKIFVRDVRIAFLEVHTELVDGFRIGEYNPTLSGRIPDYAWSYTCPRQVVYLSMFSPMEANRCVRA